MEPCFLSVWLQVPCEALKLRKSNRGHALLSVRKILLFCVKTVVMGKGYKDISSQKTRVFSMQQFQGLQLLSFHGLE